MKNQFTSEIPRARLLSSARRHPKRHAGATVGLLIGLALLLLWPVTAFAHAQLLRSAPADRAELTRAPAQVELWFNELLEESFNSVRVYAAGELNSKKRTDWAEGKPQLDSKDRTHLTVKLKPLPPGEYVAEWRVLSRDGHSAPGKFTFKVLATHAAAR